MSAAFDAWAADPELDRLIKHAIRAWPARSNAERAESVMDVARHAFEAGRMAVTKANTNVATKVCVACKRRRVLHELVTPEFKDTVCKDAASCREAMKA